VPRKWSSKAYFSIQAGDNPRILAQKMLTYLTPKDRKIIEAESSRTKGRPMGKKREAKAASSGWLNTYADMITLCMCFFVMLYEPPEVDITQIQAMTAAISNDMTGGGQSLQAGRLSDLGNSNNSLPSAEKGKSMAMSAKKAVSLFAPDIKSNKITITSDEPRSHHYARGRLVFQVRERRS
jgi:flagellar motor protein MotB